MNGSGRLAAIALLALTAGCTTYPTTDSFPTHDGLRPAGTFRVNSNQVLRMATGNAGEGTLIFQGWEHPFRFEEAKLDVIDDQTVEMVGAVYNLPNVTAFEGRYAPTQTEFGAGEGLMGMWAKNDQGVVLYLRLEGHDVALDREAAGLKVTLR